MDPPTCNPLVLATEDSAGDSDEGICSASMLQRARSYAETYEASLNTDRAIAQALAEEFADQKIEERRQRLDRIAEADAQLAKELVHKEKAQQEERRAAAAHASTTPSAPESPVPPPTGRKSPLQHGLAKLGKQFGKLVPVIPRVNGALLPSDDVVSADRDRLLARLQLYGLVERPVVGDGNCQFRALADQLCGDQHQHTGVRASVVQQLQAAPQRYAGWVPGDYGCYVAEMACPGTWGDHVTLQAAADVYGLSINVLSTFLTDGVIHITPAALRPGHEHVELWLSFWAEIHYNSLGTSAGFGAPMAMPPAPSLSPRVVYLS